MRRLVREALAQSSTQPPEMGTPATTLAVTGAAAAGSLGLPPRVTRYATRETATIAPAATAIFRFEESRDQALWAESRCREGPVSSAAEVAAADWIGQALRDSRSESTRVSTRGSIFFSTRGSILGSIRGSGFASIRASGLASGLPSV